MIYTHPNQLWTFANSASLTPGGGVELGLDVGSQFGGLPYIVLGSVTRTSPGLLVDGMQIPLDLDPFLLLSLTAPNTGLFQDTLGVLDSNGEADAGTLIPPGLDPALAGTTVSEAAVIFSVGIQHVTNATSFSLVP